MLFINKLFNSIACLLSFTNLQLVIPGRTWILLYLGRTVYKRLWACLALYGGPTEAKIELMALKWSVCDKFKDYLLGSKFTVFTDNNPLCYIKSNKLGAAQIRWLSELALYDFDIVYRTGKSNLIADALSRRPEVEEEIEREVLPKSDDEEWIAVSYQVEEQGGHISSMELNQVISELVRGTKIDKKLKDRI